MLMVLPVLAFAKRIAPRKLQSFAATVQAAAPLPETVTAGSSTRSTATTAAGAKAPVADACCGIGLTRTMSNAIAPIQRTIRDRLRAGMDSFESTIFLDE